jgi:hypothetical protein
MRKWKICGALAITLLVLAAPSGYARADRPCPHGWASPIDLIVRLDDEANMALFETDLDWIAQDLRIHELFVSDWLSRRLKIALVQVGPETRARTVVPMKAVERRLGELKAALEDLYSVDLVQFNHVLCPRW